MFNVKVHSVNLANVKGKAKSFRQRAGSRNGWRKAYVRLHEGQSIDMAAKP
jgi:large subunit ribosomal protein L23